MVTITSKWKTLAIVGYKGSVSRYEERRSHGGVCLLQVRRGKNGILGRRVNSNGQYKEIGNSFVLDDATLANWRETGKSNV